MRAAAAAVLCVGASCALANVAAGASAERLRAKHAELRDELARNAFGKPLQLESGDAADRITGRIHALVDHPFAAVAGALSGPGDWCEILMLHINTKACRVGADGRGSMVGVTVGGRHDDPANDDYTLAFAYRVAARTDGYLHVLLNADEGPLGTYDYRIALEAVPADRGRSFVQFSFSYGVGAPGRLAMQVYLATVGKSKIGFTVAGTHDDGRPRHVGGMRGVVERNAMRYYLAIEAYLGTLSLPPQARLERRLRDWFAAVERYPRQLHEMEQDEYLEMKRREHWRQSQASPGSQPPHTVRNTRSQFSPMSLRTSPGV